MEWFLRESLPIAWKLIIGYAEHNPKRGDEGA
jgi:hypothetical protein